MFFTFFSTTYNKINARSTSRKTTKLFSKRSAEDLPNMNWFIEELKHHMFFTFFFPSCITRLTLGQHRAKLQIFFSKQLVEDLPNLYWFRRVEGTIPTVYYLWESLKLLAWVFIIKKQWRPGVGYRFGKAAHKKREQNAVAPYKFVVIALPTQ